MSNSSSSPSLATTVAGIHLETCIYNASGPRTGSADALAKIGQSAAGAILAKSATLKSQTGNPLPRTWHHPTDKKLASLNSEGLPNAGIDYYIDPNNIRTALGGKPPTTQDTPSQPSPPLKNKPYMISISGKTLQDNLQMIDKLCDVLQNPTDPNVTVSALELNLACPNVIGKPIIGYDMTQMEQVLQAICTHPRLQRKSDNTQPQERRPGLILPLGVKMPPYFDAPHFAQAANILNAHRHCIRYVATMNTMGNALAVDIHSEAPAISANDGFAGLSGCAVKYTALANVCKLRALLHADIDVVGVGGVSCGADVFEMVLCGASAVQVGTCFWIEGPTCFARMAEELRDIMKEKGYSSIEEFRGKLKPWSKEGAQKSRAAKKAKADGVAGAGAGSGAGGVGVKSVGVDDSVYKYATVALFAIVVALVFDKYGIALV